MGVVSEERVVEEWLVAAGSGGSLVTGAGEPVTVLSPGRRNADHGPDFTDALLATRRGLIVGDIEVHVLSSGWWAHGHVTDPCYNRVVLHVVRVHDAGRDTVLANGRTVPTLVLGGPAVPLPLPLPVLPETEAWLPCRSGARSPEECGVVLDDAGLARFEEHAAVFRTALATGSQDQVLYAALLTALGYRRNAGPMARLAAALPFETVSRLPPAVLEGVLLGTAGLLPSQRTRRFAGAERPSWVWRLERAWERRGCTAALDEGDWYHARVRPGNYPVRRLAAMARLLVRYRRGGLAKGILGGVKTAGDLASLVTFPAVGYWREFFDFGRPVSGPVPALCGAGRAADIVVNVVLPFAAARCRMAGDGVGERGAVEAYRSHPDLADNAVIAEVSTQLGLPRPVTAIRQQGMLHLHRHYCLPGKCRTCPAGGG